MDYKNANSFATSSAKNRIEKGLASFYRHSKKAWEEKIKEKDLTQKTIFGDGM